MTRDSLQYHAFLLALVAAIIACPISIILAFATGYWQWLAIILPSWWYISRVLQR